MRLSDGQKNVILIISEFISLVVVCFAIYKTVLPLYETPMFLAEALYEPYWNANTSELDSSFSQIFLSNPHSWYILSVIQVLMQRYLPDMLNIHPVVFLENYYNFFLFGYFILFLSALVKNFTKYFDKFYFSSLLLPFAAIFFICSIIDIPALWILINPSWCTVYIFTTTIFLLFLSKTEYLFVNFQKPDKKEIYLIIFFVFCLAISHEAFRFILCFGSLLLLFLSKIILNIKFRKEYISYWLLLLAACSVTLFSKSSFAWLVKHCRSFKGTEDIFQNLIRYFSGYFEYIIVQNLHFIIFLLILSVLVKFFVQDKEKNKRLFIYIFTLVVSMLIFFITIIVGQEYDGYLYEHCGLRLILVALFLFCIFSEIGYLLKMTDNVKLRKILTVIIVFAQIGAVIRVPDFNMITFKDVIENKEKLQIMYLTEKMFVLYGKEHKKFYYVNQKYVFDEFSILYLLDRYDKKSLRKDYENIEVCKINNKKEYLTCKMKFIKLTEEKTNDKNLKEEIKNPDFKNFDKYTVNRI